ncbi:MAG TPA: AAA family ATPase [Solirubrobacteraceae bacterium]|nr:AAA family ATPase [Solirubrobacteraceae bacterium]
MIEHRTQPLGAGLRGRADECALLDDLVSAVRRAESRSLVLRGEAGIGKTALLEYLVGSASDLRVVRAMGVESEMELAYAGLHQLCGPLLEQIRSLPAPQRQALDVVFGLGAGVAPDRFLVGLGLLSLLSEVAEERPLLCVVDDAQWLDQASALTLAFVARRLLAEPVGIVFAAREPGEPLQHMPELEVRGLRNGDARAVLGSVVRSRLDERVRDRIIAETRGNPLALLELPRAFTATGGFGLLEAQSLTGRIEESFVRRLEPLPEDTRLLLLAAAAEPVGDPLLLWRAADHLGIEHAAADGARAAGLVEIDERVTFRHPLVRSAIYRSVTAEERRTVHLALAQATDREADPDRRAWHLAAASAGPDEVVALELERSAHRAQARAGLAAAATFLQRAVALTGDPTRRVDRALAAAEASLHAGEFDAARGLLATAEVGPLDELQQARVELLGGQIALLSTFGGDAPALLLKAARRLERLDVNLARDTYLDAWGAALLAARLNTRADLLDVSRAARSAPQPDGVPRPSDLLLDALAVLVTDGGTAAAPLLEEATRTFGEEEVPVEGSLRWGWLTVVPTYALWDEDSTYAICVRQLSTVRHAGALARLPLDLATFSLLAVRCGEFASAEEAFAEEMALIEAAGTRRAPNNAMTLLAFRGHEAEARAMSEFVRSEASTLGQGVADQVARWAFAVLCNGLGRYREAVAAAGDASNGGLELVAVSAWASVELLEAAIRIGDRELAGIALERIVASTEFSRTDSAQGILARSRALVSEGKVAERWYRHAIDLLARTRLRPDLARAHLLYGEWLRRESRRVDAREQLRVAHEMFLAIGMEAFAERAHKELVATGEKARKRRVETRDDLTAQERQIGELARDGLSNPEIGARLFLSPRTVEWHLHKVFGKLGIRARHELAGALASSVSELVRA